MYTRLLSANLDFDSELQHVFSWALDECRDSRVFHVDRVFPPSLLNAVLVSGLGASNVTRGSFFDENTRFLVTVCCTDVIDNSEVRMPRYLDTSTETQVAEIMVKYGRPSCSP